MMAILQAKLKAIYHRPWDFIITSLASFLFAFLFSQVLSGQSTSTLNIPLLAMDESVQDSYVGEYLTHTDLHNFYWLSEEDFSESLSRTRVEFGVELYENRFVMIEGRESTNMDLVEQFIKNTYLKKEQNQRLEGLILAKYDGAEAKEKLRGIQESHLYEVKEKSFKQEIDTPIDYTYQPLFGMVLFFVIYTIAYRVLNILIEKQGGIWDRIIMSPLSKGQMYIGNLLFSFLTGYAQVVLVFTVFRFLVGVDFNGRFLLTLLALIPYVFAIVAMSLLIASLVKTVQQFNAAIPIIAISMAMIGGAYWPLEIVESDVMLKLAEIMPIKYGIDLLNGIAIYNLPLEELLKPLSMLLLMAVLMMGLGIHFMERRHL